MNSIPHQQDNLLTEIPSVLRLFKDGRVDRLVDTDFVPPSQNPVTGVISKDVTISTDVSARLFLPTNRNFGSDHKFPLLVYFHGGSFCVSSPFCEKYDGYISKLAGQANVVVVSVDYRLAPEHPIPAAYEDSWTALQWAVAHATGDGPDAWLNDRADFTRVFLGGDGAGANIAHNLGLLAGDPDYELGLGLAGIALVHPYFWGPIPIGSEMLDVSGRKATIDGLWAFICPTSPDNDDPRLNPLSENGPGLYGLGCKRVLVCVAQNDVLKDRGWLYYDDLGRSGWMGVAEIHVTEEDHGFHLSNVETEKAKDLIGRLAAFYNRDKPYL